MTASNQTYLSPIQAHTEEQVLKLQRNNWSFRGFWMLVDTDHVTICQQAPGEVPRAEISLPRNVLDHFVAAYTRPQRQRKR